MEQFRQQWRSELQKAVVSTSTKNSRDVSPAVFKTSISSSTSKESTPDVAAANNFQQKSKSESTSTTTAAAAATNADVFEKASRLFQNGIDCERQGKMHDAIRFYRQALQLVPDIEKRLLVSTNTTGVGGGRTYAMVASKSLDGN